MIRKQDILDRAAEWQLSADVVEKDYVLGWLLSSLSRHPEVKANWLFKGGTCLKKCFFETYRFSEDLDFSLRPTARYGKEELLAVLREAAADAHQNSGIELPADGIELKDRHNKQQQATYQGKIAYRGPLGRPQVSKILLDLTAHELVVDDADARPIYHAYPDDLPEDPAITYSIEELFAEKTRALLERTRPRDLYDVVQIVENHAESIAFDLAREIFQKKCGHKGISCPDSAALQKVAKMVSPYIHLDSISSEPKADIGVLEAVKVFERRSLAGEYYEDFAVNSKNHMEKSKGTLAFIAELRRILRLCVDAKDVPSTELRETFERLFGLMRRIDAGDDEIVFFADEGGSWQFGIDWARVFPRWFASVRDTSPPDEYARQVVAVVDEFEKFARERHLATAARHGSAAHRKALRELARSSAGAAKERM